MIEAQSGSKLESIAYYKIILLSKHRPVRRRSRPPHGKSRRPNCAPEYPAQLGRPIAKLEVGFESVTPYFVRGSSMNDNTLLAADRAVSGVHPHILVRDVQAPRPRRSNDRPQARSPPAGRASCKLGRTSRGTDGNRGGGGGGERATLESSYLTRPPTEAL